MAWASVARSEQGAQDGGRWARSDLAPGTTCPRAAEAVDGGATGGYGVHGATARADTRAGDCWTGEDPATRHPHAPADDPRARGADGERTGAARPGSRRRGWRACRDGATGD